MPLQIRMQGGICCPVAVCDWCHRPIERAAEGNYEWDMHRDPSPIYFTHKQCCRAFEAARSDVFFGAEELQLLPVYLERNLAMAHREAVQLATLAAMF
jgi:hypothetical protein